MNTTLRKLRVEKKLTQEKIAFELGISQKAYSKIENGKTLLSINKIIKLSEVLSVPCHYLCEISYKCYVKKTEL